MSNNAVDIRRIMELIPHRYPFLLIDRLLDIVPHESAVGLKNVTINESFFQGHFPGAPVMPGDTLHIHVRKVENRATVWKFQCEAKVDGILCAEALVTAMITDGKAK